MVINYEKAHKHTHTYTFKYLQADNLTSPVGKNEPNIHEETNCNF